MYGMSFHDRQAIIVNVERQTYREIRDLCRQELVRSFFVSKLDSDNKSINA